MSERRCESFYQPLLAFGFIRRCEREYGHTRSWHQVTDETGGRVQWEWTKEEREAVKGEKSVR